MTVSIKNAGKRFNLSCPLASFLDVSRDVICILVPGYLLEQMVFLEPAYLPVSIKGRRPTPPELVEGSAGIRK